MSEAQNNTQSLTENNVIENVISRRFKNKSRLHFWLAHGFLVVMVFVFGFGIYYFVNIDSDNDIQTILRDLDESRIILKRKVATIDSLKIEFDGVGNSALEDCVASVSSRNEDTAGTLLDILSSLRKKIFC